VQKKKCFEEILELGVATVSSTYIEALCGGPSACALGNIWTRREESFFKI